MRDVILTMADLDEAVAYFEQFDEFVIDIETVGEHRGVPVANEILWIALATHGRAVVIPMGHPNGDRLISKATWRKNKQTGERETVPRCGAPRPSSSAPRRSSRRWNP
ncbi:hypothetical protein O1L60_31255 [Streptomyces diastatochromogenes]|nr:hypothetical protein [Streptomyces diastatochromogenes]